MATIRFGAFEGGEWKQCWASVAPDQLAQSMTALDRVPEITCPALVLPGTAELAAALPGAEEPVVAEGGAHFLSYTHADEVNPHLVRLLRARA
ncbi:alpha/beta fold hydrolase [Amycolatopsis sp. NPDC049252]|uniref:alpha/beta fold hydrolase n=1 Tax=Amycolatopsis sp. NPDC049252 TaxID=3363933 RepID=UPI003713A1E5